MGASDPEELKLRVIFIGVGGPTCSGKTTLAKHLQSCLPNSFVLHQDDFAPPLSQVPVHPKYGIKDWDDAPGAIVWDKLAKEIQYVRANGKTSDAHFTHQHFNETKPVEVEPETVQFWLTKFKQLEDEFQKEGERVLWVMVDGFLLYWHPDVYNALDVRIFLRVPEAVLISRRNTRGGYTTAEGELWQDPPGYWENIVYPAYVRAHAGMFENDDLDKGKPTGKVSDLVNLRSTGRSHQLSGLYLLSNSPSTSALYEYSNMAASDLEELKTRVILIGVGGPTCSGKTTLAKHLQSCLPNSFVLHQDDFAPPVSQIPVHPKYGVQDWDDAPGATLWDELAKELQYVRANGKTSDALPPHIQHKETKPVEVEPETIQFWLTKFKQLEDEFRKEGERVLWVMLDGFLLYWYPDVYNALDIRIFLRVPEAVLMSRRNGRGGYATVGSDTVEGEGGIWQDPPGYWENIVRPAYVRAHAGMFENDDLDKGKPTGKVPELIVFESSEMGMTELFDRVCRRISNAAELLRY